MMEREIFCTYTASIRWLQNHLPACPFKKLTGYDCPGCGFQRSLMALLQGNFSESIHYYPATIPLFVTITVVLLNKRLPVDKREYISKSLYIFTGLIIVGSYILKLRNYL